MRSNSKKKRQTQRMRGVINELPLKLKTVQQLKINKCTTRANN